MLASLNHPNIATIYGLEEHQGIHALVLELVEGQTLAETSSYAGTPRRLPVAEALAIARQIVEALDAAHERGIVHRDLKPANVKVTPDGLVKVLDFGLAKAMDRRPPDSCRQNLSHSPTMTIGATHAGVILGTAAYMSPEQARGKAVDKRADIWAFGCVLYEMLTGRSRFRGETCPDVIVAILEPRAGLDGVARRDAASRQATSAAAMPREGRARAAARHRRRTPRARGRAAAPREARSLPAASRCRSAHVDSSGSPMSWG